ncbi:hypothetical protein [Streptomyces zhihengii]|uniref:hypothetical protein n=1 Tax=Streptomyces zhihengii TaxID=1818004 RepID=UPI0033A7631D
MAVGDELLWEARDKGPRAVPRLRRVAVVAVALGFVAMLLVAEYDVGWVLWVAGAYLAAELAHVGWDRRRVVEAQLVDDTGGGGARLRLRHVGGRASEFDPHRVSGVLVVRDNVDGSATLRLRLSGRRTVFGRPGPPPALMAWRAACPRAHVRDRQAYWGMPGVPD